MFKRQFILGIGLVVLLAGCKRKFVEIITILQIERNISIPTTEDILLFSFPTPQVGYVGTDAAKIMKTIDGGSSWVSLTGLPASSSIGSMAFFSENVGMVLFGFTAYRTVDGGVTWTSLGAADHVGITDDGIGVLIDCNGTSTSVRISTDQGQSFSLFDSQNQDPFTCGSFNVTGSLIMQVSGFSNSVRVWDLDRDSVFFVGHDNLAFSQTANEAYLNDVNYKGALAADEGRLMDRPRNHSFSISFFWHDNDFYSVDGDGDFMLAVGEEAFAINQYYAEDSRSRWSLVMNRNGNGFHRTFYQIRFIGNTRRFYLSGDNGYLIIGEV